MDVVPNPMTGIGRDGTIEDLSRPWGPRNAQRWTYGTSDRTIFIEAIKSLGRELTELEAALAIRAAKERWTRPPPDVKIQGLDLFLTSLCESWSGELGRDTSDFIKAVGAAKGQQVMIRSDHGGDRSAGNDH